MPAVIRRSACDDASNVMPVYSNWDLIAEVQSGAIAHLESG